MYYTVLKWFLNLSGYMNHSRNMKVSLEAIKYSRFLTVFPRDSIQYIILDNSMKSAILAGTSGGS